jgi:hypothetical protein
MRETWGIAIFWFAFVIVSSWILRRFYFTKGVILLHRFRLTAFLVETAIIGMFLFPWLPKAQGGFSGWSLVLHGNTSIAVLLALLLTSAVFFLTRNPEFLVIGALSHIAATALIFIIMLQLQPATTQLSLHDIAPIIATLLLLINTVVVLLLWHQSQKQGGSKS